MKHRLVFDNCNTDRLEYLMDAELSCGGSLTYLCTQAQALFSLYSGLDCSADTMARRDEKFLRIRHSCRGKTNTGIT